MLGIEGSCLVIEIDRQVFVSVRSGLVLIDWNRSQRCLLRSSIAMLRTLPRKVMLKL